jgi:HNH endonuclease
MAKVDRGDDDECWPWLGAVNEETGYGIFNQNGTTRAAHQIAYEIGHGPIPDGLEPDHGCRNRPCVNWWHLEAVTHQENVLRSYSPSALAARSEECPNRHRYTAETTLLIGGQRRCAICLAAKQQRRNLTKRQARMRRKLEGVMISHGGGDTLSGRRQDANAPAFNESALAAT